MKKCVLFFVLSFVALGIVHTQDIIILRSGSEFQVKITKVGDKEIFFRRFDNLEGPEYTTDKDKVALIKYQNGKREVFHAQTGGKKFGGEKSMFSEPRFQMNIYGSFVFDEQGLGFVGDVAIGMRFNRHFFIGMETGLVKASVISDRGYSYSTIIIPLATNFKLYLYTAGKIYPYFNFSTGMLFYHNNHLPLAGLYAQAGLGFDFDWFSLGTGYRFGPKHMGCFKIGVRLGKK